MVYKKLLNKFTYLVALSSYLNYIILIIHSIEIFHTLNSIGIYKI